ncbi:MAG TPA: hypothetical protein VHB21_00030 [Minicystis sp.]|nr:hypothetical protein [Minicystis sp.]
MPPAADALVCARCVLPSSFPGAAFDAEGVCRLCREAPPVERAREARAALLEKLEGVFDSHRGLGPYDAIVAFSGGKDSSYTLMALVERFRLRCLAVTIDNGFIAPGASENLRAVTAALGVDWVLYRPAPAFMRRVYATSAKGGVHGRLALTRASATCNSCIALINDHMVKTALEKGVAVVAGGYIGGQVPPDAAVLEIDLDVFSRFRADAQRRYVAHFGDEARGHYGIPDELVRAARVRKLSIVNPMLALGVPESEILRAIEALGWKRTHDTGKNSTNCLLNDLGVRLHVEREGFHPYAMEVAEQVRSGLMTREDGLAKLSGVPRREDVAEQARAIGFEWPDDGG